MKRELNVFLCCVFVCVGEVPHSICADVFIDIDDEQPLMTDQVEHSGRHPQRFPHTEQIYFPSGKKDRGRVSSLKQGREQLITSGWH